jgi:hypothetical protein
MLEKPRRFRYSIRAILGLIAAMALLFGMLAPLTRPAHRQVAFAHPHVKTGETMKSPSCTSCHEAAVANLAMNLKPPARFGPKSVTRNDPHSGFSLSTRNTSDCRACHQVAIP